MSLNTALWDIEHQKILKLGEGRVVLRAMNGSHLMTQAEIEEIYGSPPVFKSLNYPATRRMMEVEKGAYFLMITYFDCLLMPVVAHGIDLIN